MRPRSEAAHGLAGGGYLRLQHSVGRLLGSKRGLVRVSLQIEVSERGASVCRGLRYTTRTGVSLMAHRMTFSSHRLQRLSPP